MQSIKDVWFWSIVMMINMFFFIFLKLVLLTKGLCLKKKYISHCGTLFCLLTNQLNGEVWYGLFFWLLRGWCNLTRSIKCITIRLWYCFIIINQILYTVRLHQYNWLRLIMQLGVDFSPSVTIYDKHW